MKKNASAIPYIREPKISTQTLKNGTELTFIDVPGTQVGDVRFFFDTGFKDFTPETYHVPHVFEHIIMESRINDKSLQDRVMVYGAETNATTEFDVLTMMMRIPATFVATGVEEITKTIQNIKVTEALVEREKVVVAREAADQFDGLAAQVTSYMFANVLSEHVPEGYEATVLSIEEINADDVKAFQKKLFTTCGLRVMVTGDISAEAKASITKSLETLSKRKPYSSLKAVDLETDLMCEALPIAETSALTVFNLVTRLENSEAVKVANAAEMYVYARYFSNPQNDGLKRLRDMGLLYGIDVQPARYGRIAERTYLLTTDAERGREGFLALLDILFGALKTKDDDQFKLLKDYAKNSMPLTHETVGEVAEWYATDITAGRKFFHVTEGAKLFAELTPEQVNEQMYRVLTQSKWQVGLAAEVPDEVFFAELQKLQEACQKTETPEECYTAYQAWKIEVEKLPVPKEVTYRSWLETAVSASALVVLFTAFIDYLPSKPNGAFISLFDLAMKDLWWGVPMIWGFLTLLYLPDGSTYKGFVRPLMVMIGAWMAFISSFHLVMTYTVDEDVPLSGSWRMLSTSFIQCSSWLSPL